MEKIPGNPVPLSKPKMDLFRTNYYEKRLSEAKWSPSEKIKWDNTEEAFNGKNDNKLIGTGNPPESVNKEGENRQLEETKKKLELATNLLDSKRNKLEVLKSDMAVKQMKINERLKTVQEEQKAVLQQFAKFLGTEIDQYIPI